MEKPEKKITPKDNNFDAADYDAPIEVEAYNEGYNQCWDDREKWLKELLPSRAENCDNCRKHEVLK